MYIFRRSSRCSFKSYIVIPRNNIKSLNSTNLDNTISIVPSANESNFLLITRCVMISRNILDFSSDPKFDRASPVELPSLPLLSPAPLSGSQKMRARGKGRSFYILGGSLPPPCRAAGGLPPGIGAAGPRQRPLRK